MFYKNTIDMVFEKLKLKYLDEEENQVLMECVVLMVVFSGPRVSSAYFDLL